MTLDSMTTEGIKSNDPHALSVIYHESAHVYLDTNKNINDYVKKGIQYYQEHGEYLLHGEAKKLTDPEFVFHEAVGNYVGDKIYNYSLTIENLKKNKDFPERYHNAIRSYGGIYNKSAKRVVYGYQPDPSCNLLCRIKKGIHNADNEVRTTTPMPEWLTTWIDNDILKNTIPKKLTKDMLRRAGINPDKIQNIDNLLNELE
jgi:hypothetical protein